MNKFIIFLVGLVVGIILATFLIWNVMPGLMLDVKKSKFGFDVTVDAIEEKAKKSGWKIPNTYRLDASLKKAGYNIKRIHVFSLCKPEHAYEVLRKDDNKKVAAMMPCRISVYETENGSVYTTSMNIGLMGSMFGGDVGKTMKKVANEEEKILNDVIE